MRVGRSALDEDAIRLIEEHNPDVEFDWTRILKGQEAPPDQRPRPSSRRTRRSRPRRRAAAPQPERISQLAGRPPADRSTGASTHSGSDARAAGEPLASSRGSGSRVSAGDRAAADVARRSSTPPPEPGSSAQTARVRGRLPGCAPGTPKSWRGFPRQSRTRRRDELKVQAERLNPDTWVTDAEVVAGLEAYETVFESLRGVVGRRRSGAGADRAAPSSRRSAATSGDDADAPCDPPTTRRATRQMNPATTCNLSV